MKEIELFYLRRCPYCIHAKKAIEELTGEVPAYGEIRIRFIEEREEAELAAQRDYYAVPAVFYNGEKLYEASSAHGYDIIKANLRAVFDKVLAG